MNPADYLLTTHAIQRFRERVRPGLAWDTAEGELSRLLALGAAASRPPTWLALSQHEHAPLYLTVGDLAFPLAPSTVDGGRWLVKTCLTRGGISASARASRNARRRGRGATSASASRSKANRRPRRLDAAPARYI